MKINGKTIDGFKPEVVVIPKGDEEFVFKAIGVLSYDVFEKLCPVPTPPTITRPGNVNEPNFDAPKYQVAINDWAEKKNAWIVINSLKATEGLEWETVNEDDPETWPNWKTEMATSFTDGELMRILEIVYLANGLSSTKIDEATKRFLATQDQARNV